MPALTPDAPVCLVWLLPALARDRGATEWLGDYERCVAWARLRWRQ